MLHGAHINKSQSQSEKQRRQLMKYFMARDERGKNNKNNKIVRLRGFFVVFNSIVIVEVLTHN